MQHSQEHHHLQPKHLDHGPVSTSSSTLHMKKLLLMIVIISIGVYCTVLLILYIFQEKLIFFPEVLPADHSFSFQTTFEEKSIQSGDAILHTLHFTKKNSKGVILFFHGNAGSLKSWGNVYEDFQRFPYDLWIMDYRGFGKSTGVIDSEAVLHKDAQSVYDAAAKLYARKKIIIYGRSIGTGVAAHLAEAHPPHMLILETPYYNFPDLVRSLYPIVPSMFVRYKLRTDRYTINKAYPIHLIHGDQDELIPYDSSQRLEQRSVGITLHTINGAGHNNISAFPSYHQILKTLLDKSN